jgi:hypothetical protein
MRLTLAVSLVATVLGAAPGVALAQGDVGVTATVPAPAPARSYGNLQPGDADFYVSGPTVSPRPMFIGPTARTGTTELGPSLWTAPQPPIGPAQSGWRDSSGWAAFGLTFTWGGPPHRPSAGPVVP